MGASMRRGGTAAEEGCVKPGSSGRRIFASQQLPSLCRIEAPGAPLSAAQHVMIVFDRTMAKVSIITLRNYGPKLGLIHMVASLTLSPRVAEM